MLRGKPKPIRYTSMPGRLDMYDLRGLCCALQVSKSGYSAWRLRPPRPSLLNNRVSQCFSKTFRKMIEDNKLKQSMSRKGNCWDNAVAESFFAAWKSSLFMVRV